LATLQRLGKAEILKPYRTQRLAKTGRIVEVSIISTALVNEAGQMYAIATTERVVASDKSDKSDLSDKQRKAQP
jgi:two-component system CheB/CheR fusion protein